jgi:hypothetical protein
MTPTRRLLVAAGLAVAALPAFAAPRLVKTTFPTPDAVIALETLKPPAASGEDAAPAIQAAIDRAAEAGGGTVFLAAGRYRLATPLTLKEGVTLRGDKPTVGRAEKGRFIPFGGKGTLLMPVAGKGSEEGPAAITMERGTGLVSVSIWYPEQSATDIQPYPWTVAGSAKVSGDNYTVRDVLFVNAYQCMKFGPEWNELHTVRDVVGTPLKTGVFVDTCTDIGRLTEIDLSPRYWETAQLPGAPATPAAKSALRRWLLREAVGIDMGRSDWEYQFRVFVSGLGTGFRYRPGAQGTTNGVMFGCQAVGCRIGLDVIQMNGVGLAATLCRFEGSEAGVATRPGYTAVTQLNDCTVVSPKGVAVRVEGKGFVTLCRSKVVGGGAGANVAGGTFVALGCTLATPAPQVRFGAAVRTGRVLSCTPAKGGKVAMAQEKPNADILLDHRTVRLEPRQPIPALISYLPAPPVRRLVDAAAYGASPDAPDNTRFLQAALAAAGKGGGTVYLAAGRYRLAGALVVPSGVEFRGSFDVPHHTQSGGSVLLATGGRGQEKGTPLIRLKPGSGVRGLTVWYPDQVLTDPQPYPWTVQSLGAGCWVTDFTIGNGWQGVDFFTHPSTGHTISYLAGGLFRRGVFVSKSDRGVVEDVQFNPHYMARLPAGLPQPRYAADPFGQVIAIQQAKLEGLVFGRAQDELILRTFLYSAIDGLKFVNDGGGASGVVVNHGTDAGSRAVTFGAVGPKGLDLYNTQLVVLGVSQVAAVVTLPEFKGSARLYNTQIWAPGSLALLQGPGKVTLEQFNDCTGPARAEAGAMRLHAGLFQGSWQPAVTLTRGTRGSDLVGCLQAKGFTVADATGKAVTLGCSPAPKPRSGPTSFSSGMEPGDPEPIRNTAQEQAGGMANVSHPSCAPVAGVGRGGSTAVRFAGHADNPEHSYAYAKLFTTHVVVHPDTVLTYWMKASNALSRKTGIDMLFDDGSTLRESGGTDTLHRGVHPGTDRGTVGEWERIVVPMGHKAGDAITVIMFAFDGRPGGGPYETLVDDVKIERTSQAR